MKLAFAVSPFYRGRLSEKAYDSMVKAGRAPSFLLICLPTGKQLLQSPALHDLQLPWPLKAMLRSRLLTALLAILIDLAPRLVIQTALRRQLPRVSIPCYFVKGINSRRAVRLLYRQRPDLIFASGCGLVGRQLCETFHQRIVHLHIGKLPDFRGVNNVEWAYLEDLPLVATVLFMSAAVDSGDIILQQEIAKAPNARTIKEIRDAAIEAAVQVVPRAFARLMEPGFRPTRQPRGRTNRYVMHDFLRHLLEQKLGLASGA